jgi:Pyruvate/2-oxoacid:ferredoxin oxidoreductase delta subunit
MPPENRRPLIDATLCDGCGICVEVCPHGSIEDPRNTQCAKCVKYCLSMEVPCEVKRPAVSYASCDGCGACVARCPQKAILWADPATLAVA